MKRLSLTTWALCLGFIVSNAWAAKDKTVSVMAEAAQLQILNEHLAVLSTIASNESIDVVSTLSERVARIHFKEGQVVKKGDLLVTLDRREATADVQRAQAVTREAEQQYQRVVTLAKQRGVSQSTVDEKWRAWKVAEAELKQAEIYLDKHQIRAAFDGRVGLRSVSVGALLQPGTVITTLDDVSQVKADFTVSAAELGYIQPGLRVTSQHPAYPNEEFEGRIQTLDTRVSESTRRLAVRALMDNADGKLRPGMLLTTQIQKPERQALMVPATSIVVLADDQIVYQVVDKEGSKIAQKRLVKTGVRTASHVEIVEGLKAGDWVVSEGALKLKSGRKVTLKEGLKP